METTPSNSPESTDQPLGTVEQRAADLLALHRLYITPEAWDTEGSITRASVPAPSEIAAKLAAYHLQDGGTDTVDANLQLGLPADARDYGLGAQILSALGLHELVLLTNSAPVKVVGLDAYGLSIHSTRPIPQD